MSGTGTDPNSGSQPSAPAATPSPSPAGPSPAAPSPPPGSPGGTAPGGQTPPEPSRQEQMGISDEVISVLGYDPFGPPPEAAPPQPPPAGQPPAVSPQPVPAGTPAAQPAAPPSEIETLRRQVNDLTQRLSQPAPAAAQPGAPGQPMDPVPAYQYEIPDQVLQMMASEDPGHRKTALSNVMTAVSRSVHGLMQKELAQVIPALARQVIQEHMGQQEVSRDFYTKYPQFDKPELRPLVYQIAAGWAQANPQAGWNAATRDAIAAVVMRTFNVQPQPAAGNGHTPPAAPVMMPTMTRPAGSPAGTEADELMEMLR